ncbi:hypothetical protein HAX54_037153 [Datura stramonium]|uniref:Uncharacterized protein n=1 Tax=Datura stramonium TaxID=4076 RepID=A0ABS8VKA6_DATST|nr:hypothetical protein [Datura stramonium]
MCCLLEALLPAGYPMRRYVDEDKHNPVWQLRLYLALDQLCPGPLGLAGAEDPTPGPTVTVLPPLGYHD